MRSLLLSASALILAVAATPVAAQDTGDALAEIIVTATRTERAVGDVTRSVSVVPQAEIARVQAPSVLNVLRELPGVSAAADGGLGGQVVIRGFSTQGFRAPLYIDNDRFRGRNTLEYNLFNPHQIERIEVVRGPASVLYGTDSFGGIINLITRRASGDPEGPFTFTDNALWLDYGSVNGMWGGRAQIGGAGNGFDVLIGANHRRADDYDSPAGELPNSGYRASSTDGAIGYSFADGHRVELIGRYSDVYRERAGGQFGAPGAAGGPDAPQRLQTDRSIVEKFVSGVWTADSLFGGMLEETRLSIYRRDLDTHVNVVPNARNPATFVDVFVVGPTVWGGSGNTTMRPADTVTLTLGGDWYLEDREGSERSTRGGPRFQDAPDAEQTSFGAFALAEWQLHPQLRIDGALRIDHVETELDPGFITDPATRDLFEAAGTRENTPVTGSLGVLFEATDNLSFWANVANAFRAPSVTEITAVGSGVNPVFRVPNADIEPERAINYEAGMRVELPQAWFEIAGFINDLEDLINRDAPTSFNGAPAVQIRNIGEARVSGIEAGGGIDLSTDWSVRGNLTWTRGTDEISGEPLAQIMPLNGLAALRWAPAGAPYFIEASLDWALDRDRVDPASERERDGYAVVNLYSALELDALSPRLPDATLRLTVENLFDSEYRLPTVPENIAFPVSPSNPLVQPGLNAILGLEVRF